MMSRVITCTHHKHETYRAVVECWRSDFVRITGLGNWGVVCENQSGDHVQMFWTKELAEKFLEARESAVYDYRHNRGYLIQVHV